MTDMKEFTKKYYDDFDELAFIKDLKREGVMDEIRHLKETGIPRCMECKINYKKINLYSWKADCEHSKNIIMFIGKP